MEKELEASSEDQQRRGLGDQQHHRHEHLELPSCRQEPCGGVKAHGVELTQEGSSGTKSRTSSRSNSNNRLEAQEQCCRNENGREESPSSTNASSGSECRKWEKSLTSRVAKQQQSPPCKGSCTSSPREEDIAPESSFLRVQNSHLEGAEPAGCAQGLPVKSSFGNKTNNATDNSGGTSTTSIRCSGYAAQQQLERMRRELPKVRAAASRDLRQQLPAFDCAECAAFYKLTNQNVGPCSHGNERGAVADALDCKSIRNKDGGKSLSSGMEGNQRVWSRHRHFAAPPSTPPGYWDL